MTGAAPRSSPASTRSSARRQCWPCRGLARPPRTATNAKRVPSGLTAGDISCRALSNVSSIGSPMAAGPAPDDADVVRAFVLGDVQEVLAVRGPCRLHPVLGLFVAHERRLAPRGEIEHAQPALLEGERLPSGDTAGWMPCAIGVSAFVAKSWRKMRQPPARALAKKRLLPSWLHAGWMSTAGCDATRSTAPPSAPTRPISRLPVDSKKMQWRPVGTPRRLEVIRGARRDCDRFAATGGHLPDIAAHRERDPVAVGTPRRIERPRRDRRHQMTLFTIAVAVAIRARRDNDRRGQRRNRRDTDREALRHVRTWRTIYPTRCLPAEGAAITPTFVFSSIVTRRSGPLRYN